MGVLPVRCYRNMNYLLGECTMLKMTLVKMLAPRGEEHVADTH